MRIISKFHDYYDSAAGYGIDKSQVIVRKNEQFEVDYEKVFGKDSFVHRNSKSFVYEDIHYSTILIGFCGKFFKCINMEMYLPTRSFFVYCDVDLNEIRKKYAVQSSTRYGYEKDIENLFFNDHLITEEIFFEQNCPILMWRWERCKEHPWKHNFVMTKWPRLKDIEFQKVVDPFTAFQEISMYQFGVLGNNEKNITVISDKDRLDQRGFDPIYGFRKRPK